MSKRIKTDILVIGAGSAGLSVAAGAAQMGADVVLLEGHRMGGDCLNYGCVPSKALIAAAKAAHAQASSDRFGVASVTPEVDYAAVMEHVAGVIATIAPTDSVERFEGLGVNVIREYGAFISPREVQAGETVITARRIVIATGSSPLVPPVPGLEDVPYLTNETLFDLRERPEHLLIIGGGPIGMEMAQAHVRLGCKVTVIEGDRALGKDDPETAAIVLDRLRAEGVEIAEDALAARVRKVEAPDQVRGGERAASADDRVPTRPGPRAGAPCSDASRGEGEVEAPDQVRGGERAASADDWVPTCPGPRAGAPCSDAMRGEGEGEAPDQVRGGVEVETEDGRIFRGSHLLMAVGRKPNVERLNLGTAEIETTRAGIKTDAGLKTTNSRVYAIGDVAGGMQFTHVAGYHAGVVIRSALLALPSKQRSDHIPWVTYTDPELAQVGLTEAEAREAHGNIEIARFDYAHNDRAIAQHETTGLIKVMVHRGRPVGVSIAGAQAGEVANLWALVLANRLGMKDVAAMVSPYPTIGEVSKRAAGAYFSPRLFDNPWVKRAVGLIQRWLP